MSATTLRTEVRGLDVSLVEGYLVITSGAEDVVMPVPLAPDDWNRVRLEASKSLLPEWNQLEEAKSRAALRSRRQFVSWLVMCAAAFSAYVSYPDIYLCLFLSLFSVFLWWHAGYAEQKAEREAQSLRNGFRRQWSYFEERLQESDETSRS